VILILGTCVISPTSRLFPPVSGTYSLLMPGTCEIRDFLAVQCSACCRVLFPLSLDTSRQCASMEYVEMFSDSQLSHIADILLNIGTIVFASLVAPVLIGSELSVGHVLSGLTRCFGFWSFGRLISHISYHDA